jgi:hypothetical protein
MASSEQSNVVARKSPGLEGANSIGQQESNQSTFRRNLVARLSRFLRHEWSVAVLYLFLDVVSWVQSALVGWFRVMHSMRRRSILRLDLIQLAVIVQALYFIMAAVAPWKRTDLCDRACYHYGSGRGQRDADLFGRDVRSNHETGRGCCF